VREDIQKRILKMLAQTLYVHLLNNMMNIMMETSVDGGDGDDMLIYQILLPLPLELPVTVFLNLLILFLCLFFPLSTKSAQFL